MVMATTTWAIIVFKMRDGPHIIQGNPTPWSSNPTSKMTNMEMRKYDSQLYERAGKNKANAVFEKIKNVKNVKINQKI